MKTPHIAALTLLAALLAGCAVGQALLAKAQKRPPAPPPNIADNLAPARPAPVGPPAQRVIYFVNDSNEVQPESLPALNGHANYLMANPGKLAVLEGHADERGSPEYNIGLGEQRAKSVAQLLKLQGVADAQMQTISLGEEKPQDPGHDEGAWQRNRRVEISYPEP